MYFMYSRNCKAHIYYRSTVHLSNLDSAANLYLFNPGIKDLPCSPTSFPGSFPWLGAGAEYPKPWKRPWERGCLFYSMVERPEKLRLTWTH